MRLYHAATGSTPSPRFFAVSSTRKSRPNNFFLSLPRGVRDAVLLLTIYASILILRHVVEPVEPVEPVESVESTEQTKEPSANSSTESNSAKDNESSETPSKLKLFIKLFNQR